MAEARAGAQASCKRGGDHRGHTIHKPSGDHPSVCSDDDGESYIMHPNGRWLERGDRPLVSHASIDQESALLQPAAPALIPEKARLCRDGASVESLSNERIKRRGMPLPVTSPASVGQVQTPRAPEYALVTGASVVPAEELCTTGPCPVQAAPLLCPLLSDQPPASSPPPASFPCSC